MDIDRWRKMELAIAEFLDAWRIIPRMIVGGYGYIVYWILIEWYAKLQPHMLEGCVADNMADCIVQAPTMEHTALVVTVVGLCAPIISFYVTTGKKWNGFTPWKKSTEEKPTTLIEDKSED